VTPFDVVEPRSVKEAIALIDPDDANVRVIAGGTALMLLMKAGVFQPRRLISLRKFDDSLSGIAATPSGELRIGAMTPLSAVEHSPQVLRHAPVIGRTMRRLSNVRVRNVATIGGALAHADPHMDLPPVLIALGASVSIVGRSGGRTILVEDLLTGYYETALAKNELITDVRIPAQAAARAVYCKVTTGSADDWPALGVAVALVAEGSTVKSARLVASAATTKATRLTAAEEALIGSTADEAALKAVAEAAAEEIDILADVRGSASYKRELLRVYMVRAIRAAMQASGAPH
jgi:aerobic carbon-monoxide dehydrogenase medium subunit